MFLLPDGTMIVQTVNFAIFFAILSVVFLRPVSAAIKKRRAYIDGLTADYDTYQAEANALRKQADDARAAARRDAELTIAKGRAETSNATADLAGEYAGRVSQTIEETQKTVAGELDAARAGQDATVRSLADLMLEKTVPGAAK
ncbi:MAG: ATP synthase F0 subunit B [Candidatus Eremiobacteraeota bacterium]|nr:ATP synthase F0 subunit B [Candidatus Eremiobacteraeota bacterium]